MENVFQFLFHGLLVEIFAFISDSDTPPIHLGVLSLTEQCHTQVYVDNLKNKDDHKSKDDLKIETNSKIKIT